MSAVMKRRLSASRCWARVASRTRAARPAISSAARTSSAMMSSPARTPASSWGGVIRGSVAITQRLCHEKPVGPRAQLAHRARRPRLSRPTRDRPTTGLDGPLRAPAPRQLGIARAGARRPRVLAGEELLDLLGELAAHELIQRHLVENHAHGAARRDPHLLEMTELRRVLDLVRTQSVDVRE